jgi:hypothetical protein
MSCLSLIKIWVLKIARVIFLNGRHASVSAQIMPVILPVTFELHKPMHASLTSETCLHGGAYHCSKGHCRPERAYQAAHEAMQQVAGAAKHEAGLNRNADEAKMHGLHGMIVSVNCP